MQAGTYRYYGILWCSSVTSSFRSGIRTSGNCTASISVPIFDPYTRLFLRTRKQRFLDTMDEVIQ